MTLTRVVSVKPRDVTFKRLEDRHVPACCVRRIRARRDLTEIRDRYKTMTYGAELTKKNTEFQEKDDRPATARETCGSQILFVCRCFYSCHCWPDQVCDFSQSFPLAVLIYVK